MMRSHTQEHPCSSLATTTARSALAIGALLIATGCSSPESGAEVAEPETPSGDQAIIEELAARAGATGGESVLFWSSDERRVAFRNTAQINPTRTVTASSSPFPLEEAKRDLSSLTYSVEDESYTVGDYLSMPESMSVIVVKNGKVLFEEYTGGNDDASRWISFSVTKSVTSMLIGAAVADGYIRSVSEPVVTYLPHLDGTAYEGATVEDVLHMASGVAWNEDYADPESDVANAGGANGIVLQKYLAELGKENEPGEEFNYNTGETNLAGEILRSAIGNNAATYLTTKIWQPFGMESDADWVLGGLGGGELGGCCIAATLRDYARLGLFAMNDGVLPDGTRVLPEGWMAQSTEPSQGFEGYGYLWWLSGDGSYSARGIFGQMIFVDPANELVIAMHNLADEATGSDFAQHSAAVTGALRQAAIEAGP
ncbi:MAG: serine hydrolase domain-containing protein [Acidobacteriota bacterium]